MNARRAEIKLFLDGADVTADINRDLLSMTYTDNEEDKADDLQLSLADREWIWLGNWLNNATAGKSAEVSAVIIQKNWESAGDRVLDCGTFEVDTVEGSGPPAKVNIKAGSIPYKTAARTQKKTKAWEKIKLDNGGEFADVDRMERSPLRKTLKRTKVYFCHPYSSYERGSNECQNKMIRRPFPKGTDFGNVTDAEVARAEQWMNNYPRKILGWKTSEMLFRECVAALI